MERLSDNLPLERRGAEHTGKNHGKGGRKDEGFKLLEHMADHRSFVFGDRVGLR